MRAIGLHICAYICVSKIDLWSELLIYGHHDTDVPGLSGSVQ